MFSRSPSVSSLWAKPSLEVLEDRVVPAVIAWDGEAGDNLWHNPVNWFNQTTETNPNNFLPGPNDDVVIGTGFDGETIVLSSAGEQYTVNSIDSEASLAIAQSGRLELAQDSRVADLTLDTARPDYDLVAEVRLDVEGDFTLRRGGILGLDLQVVRCGRGAMSTSAATSSTRGR